MPSAGPSIHASRAGVPKIGCHAGAIAALDPPPICPRSPATIRRVPSRSRTTTCLLPQVSRPPPLTKASLPSTLHCAQARDPSVVPRSTFARVCTSTTYRVVAAPSAASELLVVASSQNDTRPSTHHLSPYRNDSALLESKICEGAAPVEMPQRVARRRFERRDGTGARLVPADHELEAIGAPGVAT